MSDQGALFGDGEGAPEGWCFDCSARHRRGEHLTKPAGYPLYDGTPPHEAPSTSVAAADSMLPHTNRLQAEVLAAIAATGPDGATDDEIEQRTGLRHQTASARRRELYLLGLIEATGERRTRSGRRARVWTVKPKGEA